MKKFFNSITNKLNSIAVSAKTAIANIRGEGYVDSGVKILIAVVLGALVLTLLYALLKTTVMSNVTTKVSELFNYSGGTV